MSSPIMVLSYGEAKHAYVRTVMNLNNLKLLCQQGQIFKFYKRNNINLSSISGNKLCVIGYVYIRLLLGSYLMRMPVYGINNMHNSFLLGSDAMFKYKIVIDFESEELSVKSEVRLLTAKVIKILPKSNAIIPVYSNSNILIPRLMGKIVYMTLLCLDFTLIIFHSTLKKLIK